MSTDVPTQADFLLPSQRSQGLDAWHAWETFGGRTLDEAYAIFRENALGYQEDLVWMAAKPFCFYLPMALRYLQSEDSSGDGDIVNCLSEDIEFHIGRGHDISAAIPCIRKICDYVITHYSKFDVTPTIYGDLRQRYEQLRKKIGEPVAGPNSR